MSFLLNLRAGLSDILSRFREDETIHFEIQVNHWKYGDKEKPNYFGMCFVTPTFLRELRDLCERHQCGEKR